MRNLLMVFAAAVLLFGCIGPAGPTVVPNASNATPTPNVTQNVTPPTPAPEVEVSVQAGDIYDDENVSVSLQLKNFKFGSQGCSVMPGLGHVAVTVDNGMPTTYMKSSFVLPLSMGNHTISVELVDCKGNSLSPAVKDSVSVEVKKRPVPFIGPKITVLSPASGAKINATTVTVTVKVENLTLKTPQGVFVPGEGHLHYSINGGSPVVSTSTTQKFDNLNAGTYTVNVSAMAGNHKPLNASATVTFQVTYMPPPPPPPPPAQNKTPVYREVMYNNDKFSPAWVDVKQGDLVRITFIPDQFNSYPEGMIIKSDYFDTGLIPRTGNATVEFTAVDSFAFRSYWYGGEFVRGVGHVRVN